MSARTNDRWPDEVDHEEDRGKVYCYLCDRLGSHLSEIHDTEGGESDGD